MTVALLAKIYRAPCAAKPAAAPKATAAPTYFTQIHVKYFQKWQTR
jgi:hypothetical protein